MGDSRAERRREHVEALRRTSFRVYGLDGPATQQRKVVKVTEDISVDGVGSIVGIEIQHMLTHHPEHLLTVSSGLDQGHYDTITRARRELAAHLWEATFDDPDVRRLNEDARRARWNDELKIAQHEADEAQSARLPATVDAKPGDFQLVSRSGQWAAAAVVRGVIITIASRGEPIADLSLRPVTDPETFLTD